MGNHLMKAAVVDFGIQWACWAVASFFKTEKFYDLAGSATFIILALKTLRDNKQYFIRQRINTGLVVAWATRLGIFLFSRILKEGQDRRFDRVRDNPKLFLLYWTIQGVWVLCTLLPVLILNNKDGAMHLGKKDFLGYSMWGVGFILEAVADYQKSCFRSNPENAGRFINEGLWRIVQYPNYLGEIMMWTGIYISCSSVFEHLEHIAVISPLFLTYLLTNVSGIPLQQKSAMRRYGNNAEFLEYLRNTKKLIPFVW